MYYKRNNNMNVDFNKLLLSLEISNRDIDFLNHNLPFDELKNKWNDFKKILSIRRKRLALKYHPDCGGSLLKMQEINEAYDLMMQIEIRPKIKKVNIYQAQYNYASTTSTSTTGGWYYYS